MDPSMTSTSPILQPPLAAVPRSARLDLLRGMLGRLVDVPPGGQHYLMDKVLPLLRREALDPDAHLRAEQSHLIMRSLDELEHEAACMAPDPDLFGRKAQILLDVLALT
jgi:hypothetical protein